MFHFIKIINLSFLITLFANLFIHLIIRFIINNFHHLILNFLTISNFYLIIDLMLMPIIIDYSLNFVFLQIFYWLNFIDLNSILINFCSLIYDYLIKILYLINLVLINQFMFLIHQFIINFIKFNFHNFICLLIFIKFVFIIITYSFTIFDFKCILIL